MRHTVKEGEDMKWKDVARTTALTLGPLAVFVALLEVRLATGMGPWDIRLTCAIAVMTGMWMVHAILLWGPTPEPEPEPEKKPQADGPFDPMASLVRSLTEQAGAAPIPVIQVGSGEVCEGCNEVHGEPMVVVPLPDASFLVSHKDRDNETGECDWAVHAADMAQARSTAQLHEEFQCVRRHANR